MLVNWGATKGSHLLVLGIILTETLGLVLVKERLCRAALRLEYISTGFLILRRDCVVINMVEGRFHRASYGLP